jgi:drug/metabolite transporter (DMT)-like permease
VVAPFIYMQLIWASVLGLLVFGDTPDRWTLAGGTIVVASGLFLVVQERASPRSR